MKKCNCLFCNHKAIEETQKFVSGKKNPETGENIIVPDAKAFVCSNCKESWFTETHQKYIDRYIQKILFTPLKPEEIKLIRKSLPFITKKQLADFLCLNEKAFVKWEKSYSTPNSANDLLLRLIARSEDNLKFVEYLHSINFKFNEKDYYYTKKYKTITSGTVESNHIL